MLIETRHTRRAKEEALGECDDGAVGDSVRVVEGEPEGSRGKRDVRKIFASAPQAFEKG